MMPDMTLISDAMHGVTLPCMVSHYTREAFELTVGVSVGCVGPLTMNYNFISSTN